MQSNFKKNKFISRKSITVFPEGKILFTQYNFHKLNLSAEKVLFSEGFWASYFKRFLKKFQNNKRQIMGFLEL